MKLTDWLDCKLTGGHHYVPVEYRVPKSPANRICGSEARYKCQKCGKVTGWR